MAILECNAQLWTEMYKLFEFHSKQNLTTPYIQNYDESEHHTHTCVLKIPKFIFLFFPLY